MPPPRNRPSFVTTALIDESANNPSRIDPTRPLEAAADPDDRRLERLELTSAGVSAFADLIEVAKAYEDGLHARLGDEGFAALRAALAAIETALPASAEEREAI